MIISLILALLAGILAGTFTGIAPGIHVNLISAILLSLLPAFISVPLISLAVFIVAMSITHSFLDFIPSVYLGAPDEDNFLSILPGHRMFNIGLGHSAVVFTLYGSIVALPTILIFTPIFIYALPVIFEATKTIIPFILIFISAFLIFREEKILPALTIFLLSGFLGFFALNLPIEQPLLPLLTGLFGISNLIISLKNPSKAQKQIIKPLKKIILPKKELIKSSIASAISAPLCSFLPGIGSGHAAFIGSELTKQSEKNDKSFLFMNGSITTIVAALNFIALYSIGKARSGTSAVIKEILNPFTRTDLFIILAAIIFTSLVAFFIGIQISKFFAKNIDKINYKFLSLFTILFLVAINFIFTNPLGILVLATSTALGIFAILSESKRINLMGSIILPVVLFYLVF